MIDAKEQRIRADMKRLLETAGIPAKRIEVYGSQIVITCYAHDAAERFADLLRHFAKVRGIVDTLDDAVVNKNTTLKPSKVRVSRVFAVI